MNNDSLKAKIKAMSGRLLKYEDYEYLSGLGKVEAIGAALKEYPGYCRFLSDLNNQALRRTPIERRLTLSVADDYTKMHKFITDHSTRLIIECFFRKFEIQVIQTLLSNVYDERPNYYSETELTGELSRKLCIRIDTLINAKTPAEFIDNLGGTVYHPVLSRVYGPDTTLFTYEMQLDLFYYMNLWDTISKHPAKHDKQVLTHIVGTEIDLKNITWSFRFKRYYDLEPFHIYSYLIPVSYRLRVSDLKKMVETADLSDQDKLNAALNLKYKHVFKESTTLEADYNTKMRTVYQGAVKTEPNSIAEALAYLFYKELEIRSLTSLIEGVRYSLTPDTIMEYLSSNGLIA